MLSEEYGFFADWSANELADTLPSDNRKEVIKALETIQDWAREGENYISTVNWAVFYTALENRADRKEMI